MHWPIALFGEADPVPETCLPPGHREALDLAAPTPWAREPKAALDPNPPMPAQSLEMGHQFRIGGIHVTRDRVASVRYSERLNSSKSSFSFQRTDRYGIVGQKHSHFQRDS